MSVQTSRPLLQSAENPGSNYDREPTISAIARDMDVMVPMRDGVKICVDVYRPDAPGKFPALLAFAIYNKDFQGPDMAEALPPQPAWSPLWTGPMEAGDTHFFVSRGYVHVIGSPRGVGKSEGGGSREWDCYDLIEWIAAQPWCDGNVGMVGISGFGAEQLAASRRSSRRISRRSFRSTRAAPMASSAASATNIPAASFICSAIWSATSRRCISTRAARRAAAGAREALARGDEQSRLQDVSARLQSDRAEGPAHAALLHVLIEPYDNEAAVAKSEKEFADIKVPTYTGSGWYGYTYKTHLNGASTGIATSACRRSCCCRGPAHLERPYHTMHGEVLRWHDHWLKGIDTGIMKEPPVSYWVMGANQWRTASDWPVPETQWTKLYLTSWERLTPDTPAPSSVTETQSPDSFVQMPPSQTTTIQRLRYMTDPLPNDVLVAGPIVVTLYAVDRSGRHQLDRGAQGRRSRRVGDERARRRARGAEKSARARDHPRLAESLAPRRRCEALAAVLAVASA